jgi:hypothetical protein
MSQVKRFIYKRVVQGDLDKTAAQGAKATSGGGARDMRLNPYPSFERVLAAMFPTVEQHQTTRQGKQVLVTIRTGQLWPAGVKAPAPTKVEVWPPYATRPRDGRIARLPEIPTFSLSNLPPQSGGSRYYLIWEDTNALWGQWVSETDLQSGAWDQAVAAPILSTTALALQRRGNARGFVDFGLGTSGHFHA